MTTRPFVRRTRVFLFAALAVLSLSHPQATLAQAPVVFTTARPDDSRASSVQQSPDNPVKVLRSRSLSVSKEAVEPMLRSFAAHRSSFGRIQAETATNSRELSLNLFADTNLLLRVDSFQATHDGEGLTLRGAIGPDDEGNAILTFYRGALSGLVRLPNGERYEIFVPTSGSGEVRQVEFEGFRGEGTDAVVPPEFAQAAKGSADIAASADSISTAAVVDNRLAATSNTVDVLVAYTARARQARGDAVGMVAHINQVIAESNDGLVRSQVNMQFRLARAVEVSYNDSSSSMGYGTALTAFRGSSDGQMDEVHGLRDQYGADIATLWVNPPIPTSGSFTVGLAYLMTSNPGGFGTYSFSVVHQGYAGGASAAFPHEAGHNMGLNHDPAHGGSSGALFPDSRGYQQLSLNPKFFTIMAYSSGCSGCTPLIQYSNPAVKYQLIPTGVTGSIDAARTLNYVAPYVASWRGSVSAPAPCAYSVSPTSFSSSSTGGSFSITVSTTSGCSWAPSTGNSWISLSSTASRTGSGSFTATVAQNGSTTSRSGTVSAGGKSVSVSQAGAQASPSPTPALSVSPTSISMVAAKGSDKPVKTTVNVAAGGAIVPVSISTSAPSWLSVSRTTLQTPGSVTISANASKLSAGTYSGTVVLTASGTTNGTVQIPVSLEVRPTGKIRSNSKGLSFKGKPSKSPASQSLVVIGDSSESSIAATLGESSWLFSSQTVEEGALHLEVGVDTSGLAPGVYDSAITLSCDPEPCEVEEIPVRLEISDDVEVEGRARTASGGIVSAASYEQGVSAGAWSSVFGENLSRSARGWTLADFSGAHMPTDLDGVRVRVDGKPAAISYINAGQINFQTPSNIAEGWVLVEVETPNGSDSSWVFASRETPGFFQFDAEGNVAALHSDGTPVGRRLGGSYTGRPATPGTVVAIYGTGFGPTDPDVLAGQLFNGAATLVNRDLVTVTIGGVEAELQFAGLSGAGLNQVNAVVPDLPAGSYDVVATVDNSITQFHGRLLIE